MKIKKIINLCKASGAILLYNDKVNNVQYLANGFGLYMFSIQPPITTETICILNDITQSKQENMRIETADIGELKKIIVSDSLKTDLHATPADITVTSSGITFMPFYSELGVLLIDKSYLAPFGNNEELTYCVRTMPSGAPYLCVMKGLLFCAAITPYIITDSLIKDVETLLNSLVCGIALQKQIEENRNVTYTTDDSGIDIAAE